MALLPCICVFVCMLVCGGVSIFVKLNYIVE